MNKKMALIILIVVLVGSVAGCDSISPAIGRGKDITRILASGVIEAEQVAVASEISGRVSTLIVEEGTTVNQGDLLFTLEDDLLETQKVQVEAQFAAAAAQQQIAAGALEGAKAGLQAAQALLTSAQIQNQLVLMEVYALEEPDRVDNWNESTPSQINIPAWYFQQSEQIAAAEIEVNQAWEFYQAELSNFEDTAADIGNQEFLDAEKRLAEAQAAFEVSRSLNDRQVGYDGREEIEDFIDTIYEKAESELEAAQKSFDQLLAGAEYDDLLEARARVSVARERYDLARDQLFSLYLGDHSLEVQAAETAVAQAEAEVKLAEAQITQAEFGLRSAETAMVAAEAALNQVNLHLERLRISSPIDGVILASTINEGEVLAAGYTAMTVGDIANLTVTVYLPEDMYGQISLGDTANLTTDSFPDETFQAEVFRIADEAEYTPRNVQTQEERRNTVFAIELAVKNTDGRLKPGMPADVAFLP